MGDGDGDGVDEKQRARLKAWAYPANSNSTGNVPTATLRPDSLNDELTVDDWASSDGLDGATPRPTKTQFTLVPTLQTPIPPSQQQHGNVSPRAHLRGFEGHPFPMYTYPPPPPPAAHVDAR